MAKQVTFEFELGEHVRDKITQLEGIALARHDHITGCKQYTVQPQGTDKDGKIRDCYYFDEARLERVKKKQIEIVAAAQAPGGPQRVPSRPSPRRA